MQEIYMQPREGLAWLETRFQGIALVVPNYLSESWDTPSKVSSTSLFQHSWDKKLGRPFPFHHLLPFLWFDPCFSPTTDGIACVLFSPASVSHHRRLVCTTSIPRSAQLMRTRPSSDIGPHAQVQQCDPATSIRHVTGRQQLSFHA